MYYPEIGCETPENYAFRCWFSGDYWSMDQYDFRVAYVDGRPEVELRDWPSEEALWASCRK